MNFSFQFSQNDWLGLCLIWLALCLFQTTTKTAVAWWLWLSRTGTLPARMRRTLWSHWLIIHKYNQGSGQFSFSTALSITNKQIDSNYFKIFSSFIIASKSLSFFSWRKKKGEKKIKNFYLLLMPISFLPSLWTTAALQFNVTGSSSTTVAFDGCSMMTNVE